MMTNKKELAELISETITEIGATLEANKVETLFSKPPNPSLGDIAFPTFQLARQLRRSPHLIAKTLQEALFPKISVHPAFTKSVATGPYINVTFDPSYYARQILTLSAQKTAGSQTIGAGKTVVIDYSSPNIAKPFGIGHLRSTAIGHALRNIFETLGYSVIGINHLGDWGTQFGKMMAAYEHWGDDNALKTEPISHLYELYVRFHLAAKTDPELEEQGRIWFKRLEEKDEKALKYWTRFRALSLRQFEQIYARLDIHFDHYWGEAFYNDKLADFVISAKATNVPVMSEGALVIELEGLNPCLLLKSDGATLYSTRDLTAAIYRFEKLNFDQMLYVVGTPQSNHFKQVFTSLDRLGYSWFDRLHHVPFGHIHGISTRKGTLVFLKDILDRGKAQARSALEKRAGFTDQERDEVAEQIAVGAVIFYDLSRNRVKDYDFSWDLMLHGLNPGESGRTGPYLQYTHVRLVSVIDGYKAKFGELPSIETVDFSLLQEPATRAVITQLAQFNKTLAQAATHYEPAMLSRYLLDLAELFNSFYSGGHKIVSENRSLSASRITLVLAVRQVLSRGLQILNVPLPNKM